MRSQSSKPPAWSAGEEAFRKHRQAITQLAQSGDAKKLASLLKQSGGVQQAAQAAAQGSPEQLMQLVNQLTSTQEGAELMDRLRRQAEQAGLS